MSMPPSRRKRATALEIISGWATIYETVREELVGRGLDPVESAKTAAYVAATLAKEIEYGDESRKH